MKPFFKPFLTGAVLCACLASPAAAQSGRPGSDIPEKAARVQETIDRIYRYLDGCTPAAVVDAKGKPIRDYAAIDGESCLQKGDFGISTYEWGVTYSGMLLAGEVTGKPEYGRYVFERLNLLGALYPHVRKYAHETGYPMRLGTLQSPKWLDDCGAMTAAMIKATLAAPEQAKAFRPLLDNWFNFVMYKEYRLGDGILARHRPAENSVWLDDMYMGITPIAFRARLSRVERGDLTQKYANEAINQVLLFKKYLWVPGKNLYRHGWVEGMAEHPDYHWARANGWAVLAMCDVLDAVPENTQGWTEVRDLLVSLLRGLAQYQSPEGTWHQLIDKTESYLETSASAMFVYGYLHAINRGWIDRTAYQNVALAGWEGIARQVNDKGQVENTCVGTGLGWTNTFYEHRPVSPLAAHGYGPVLLAAAELLRMYQSTPATLPAFEPIGPAAPGRPTVWLAGDSTCKNGQGDGANGQWGWGSFFGEYLSADVQVRNQAVGGLSSRTFFNDRWPGIRDNISPGDFVLIQFGHNDLSPINSGRARGTLDGTGDEPEIFVMERDGSSEEVYSYGHYIRTMVRQTRMRGGIPIVLSPTPQNSWDGEHGIARFTDTFNAWCREVALQEGVTFLDLNGLCASEYEKIGRTQAQKDYFADSVHTFEPGARLYCKTLADALKTQDTPLAKYVK